MQLSLESRIASVDHQVPHAAPPAPGDLVVVLEQDIFTARRIDTVLRNVGYRVLAFTEPGAGLPVVSTHACDLVLAQHSMAPRHAARLQRIAQSSQGVRRPGFVLITDTPHLLTDAERRTYDAIVSRPICAIDLLAAMRRASARRSTPITAAPPDLRRLAIN